METEGRGPILELLIQTDPEKTAELEGEGCRVRMIPFSGRATGPIFQGLIAPGAVDTQITNAAEVRHMSARYMLIGHDCTGAPCRIFVQNEGWFTDGARPRPWHSVPAFLTDSRTLAPVLHRNCFIGEGLRDAEGLHIRFYETAAGR